MSGWKERIQRAFISVHGDTRDAVQVRASKEMMEALTRPVVPAAEKPTPTLQEQQVFDERAKQAFEQRAQALAHCALRSTRLYTHQALRRGVHQCFEVTAPVETAEELFRQGLKQLSEGK